MRHDVRVVPPELVTFTLDAVALTIDGVSADGQPVPFVHDGQKIVVRPTPPWKRGESHALVIAYRGRPERGIYFVAPDEAYPDKPLQAWTQGQDEDSRFWFPCADYPNQKATTEIRVRVPRGFEAISNGRLVSREERGERTEFHWVQEIPHVTYLVSLVVGQFDIVDDRAGATALRYFVPRGSGRHAQRTFGRTPRMIEVFERLFGHPYPYPKYDQVVVTDFLCGGMENTSATTLYEYAMLDETVEDAVDRDDLISHELAHQWFGDLLTCRDWAHAWLNEGFATYAEVLWYEHGESRERAAYHLLQASRNYFEECRNEYRRPIVTHTYEAPVDIFDRHLYEKAGCALHHLRLELGDEVFFRGLRRYVADSRARARRDARPPPRVRDRVRQEPRAVLRSVGLPRGPPRDRGDARLRRSRRAASRSTSGRPRKGPRTGPSASDSPAASISPDESPHSSSATFDVSESQHAFVWNLPDDPRGIRAGQGGLPLVRIGFRRSDSGLAHQLEEDEDLLGRIEAAEQLGKSATDAAVAALAGRLTREPTWMGQVEIARALGEARGLKARTALVAALDLRQPRSRAAVAGALGAFREDDVAASALERLLEREKAPLVRAAAYKRARRDTVSGGPRHVDEGPLGAELERGHRTILSRRTRPLARQETRSALRELAAPRRARAPTRSRRSTPCVRHLWLSRSGHRSASSSSSSSRTRRTGSRTPLCAGSGASTTPPRFPRSNVSLRDGSPTRGSGGPHARRSRRSRTRRPGNGRRLVRTGSSGSRPSSAS